MRNQIMAYLALGIVYILFDAPTSGGERKTPLPFRFLYGTAAINILDIALFKWIAHIPNMFSPEIYTLTFSINYVLTGTVLAGSLFGFRHLVPQLTGLEKNEEARPVWLSAIMALCVALGLMLVFFSDWFVSYFGHPTPEEFLFNLQAPIKGTSKETYIYILNGPFLKAMCVLVIMLELMRLNLRFVKRFKQKSDAAKHINKRNFRNRIKALLSVLFLLACGGYAISQTGLAAALRAYGESSEYIEQNYVDIRNVKAKFPEKKRNLIHIYLESVENSYFDKRTGGYMRQNLMKELEELSVEGVSFSHSEQMGGPRQTHGSSWSVASMINMSCGIPLKAAMRPNDYGRAGYFLPGCYNLGDFLEDNGYEQTVMFGADADFGGLSTFYSSHGGFKIFDHKYALKTGLLPKGYNVWWGFEDDRLYEFAKEELLRLAAVGKPFNFTMETADTHFPRGYLSEMAPTPYADHYANAIAYSSAEAVKFVRWIQRQDFYENTTVVITGDHLSMDQDFFRDFDPSYRRSIFNLILNSPVSAENTKNREYAPLDFYPTIVSALGITWEGHRLGLGTDLFSDEPTLIERDGFGKFNEEISKNSNFYNEELISEWKTH